MRSAEGLELSVVIPVFDEEENVERLYEELTESLVALGSDYEVLFVDDGSRDQTPDLLRKISHRDSRVKILRFRRNYGQTAAIQAGFDHADGRVVVTMDGDLQNDPADIGRLLEQLARGWDVVCGWRKDRQDPWLTRRLPSQVANWLIRMSTGIRIHDNGCTLKAYRREVVKRARLYAEMHRFLAPMLSLSGCRYTELVVHHRSRQFGRSKYGLSRIWTVFLDLLTVKMLLRFATHPAAWFGLLSFPLFLAAILSVGFSIYFYATNPASWTFPIVVPSISLLLVFAALHLLLLGMFSELVVRVGDYRETEPLLTGLEEKVRSG